VAEDSKDYGGREGEREREERKNVKVLNKIFGKRISNTENVHKMKKLKTQKNVAKV